MAKASGAQGAKGVSIGAIEERARGVAEALCMELVEVTFQKESRGKCLCFYVDLPTGVSLDDCERFHKQLQPLLEDVDYDVMEVSSPGVDRPVKTQRDFEKNEGATVEVKLFAPIDGAKLYRGLLRAMDDATVTVECENGLRTFERKKVAIVKPVIELDDEIFENDDESREEP